jgi:DNA-binding IclR family transcriptional regulator
MRAEAFCVALLVEEMPPSMATGGAPTSPNTTDLLTTLDAARLADVSPATIRLWRRIGRLVPAVCAASGLALYARSDVGRVAAERKAERNGSRQREQRGVPVPTV